MIHDTQTYAPVAVFEILSQSDRLSGLAAPRAGVKPAALRLEAGGDVICVVRASRFSDEASTRGLRFGWCGFELPGLARALAISSDVTVRCHATNETLLKLVAGPDVFDAAARQGTILDLAAIMERGSAGERADVEHILPFAIDHRTRLGFHSFIEATYQMIVGRLPTDSERRKLEQKTATGEGVEKLLRKLADDRRKSGYPFKLPGPFHSAFRYDRGLLR
ncbi:hypothetical protein MMB232_03181 [Brevundimonas subvibrioides]|uniref:hypothetical protein n=1 Tax=Brevundimonas subvibrioides TaxID=74313 RepID=UPI0032D5A45B